MRADPQREDLSDDTSDTPPPEDLAREAEATAELSGRGLRRRGIFRWLVLGGIRVTYRLWTRVAVRVFPEGTARARLADAVGIPLPDTLNLSWITPQLAVGGRIHPGDIPRLAAIGVTAVVDTRAEHVDDQAALAAHGIQLLHLPTPDTYPLTIEELCAGAAWITRRIASGNRVLVHCEHGVGRSVLLTAAALVVGGMSADEAIRLVQSQRWQAAPNHRQLARLQEFERYARGAGANACQ